MSSSSRLELAINCIRGSRVFTHQFLKDLTDSEWVWSPPQYTTHLAWQVGHISVAQYSLCIRRVRGRSSADESLISDAFMEAFKLGSKPIADPDKNPPLDEIKRVFEAVHEQAIAELARRTEAELDTPLDEPHPRFKTKLSAVEFSPLHEMVHAGQIAMLRRLMGKPPLR
jgi:DinB family protein